MTDRVVGALLVLLAAAYGAAALQLKVPLATDPVGPRAFPVLLALVLAALGLSLIARPGREPQWPAFRLFGKLILVVGSFLVFALLFERLGFIPLSILLATGLGVLAGGSPLKSLAMGTATGLVMYALFRYGLDLPLEPWGSMLGGR